MQYKLANGNILTEEQIEQEALEYEAGTWEGHLTNIRVGHPPLTHEKLVPVTVKFPYSMVQAIDKKGSNRSDYIRRALTEYLNRQTLTA